MSKPIVDKAEVSIDFPDKFYHGSFGRTSRFDVVVDEQGLHISLDRPGVEQRHVMFHVHYHLFGSILETLAEQLAANKTVPPEHRKQLKAVVAKLDKALKK